MDVDRALALVLALVLALAFKFGLALALTLALALALALGLPVRRSREAAEEGMGTLERRTGMTSAPGAGAGTGTGTGNGAGAGTGTGACEAGSARPRPRVGRAGPNDAASSRMRWYRLKRCGEPEAASNALILAARSLALRSAASHDAVLQVVTATA